VDDKQLKDVFTEICEQENFSDEFKRFSRDAIVILKLCEMYKEGTGKKITKENIEDDKGVIKFIMATIPLLNKLGTGIYLSENMIKKIVLGFQYLEQK